MRDPERRGACARIARQFVLARAHRPGDAFEAGRRAVRAARQMSGALRIRAAASAQEALHQPILKAVKGVASSCADDRGLTGAAAFLSRGARRRLWHDPLLVA